MNCTSRDYVLVYIRLVHTNTVLGALTVDAATMQQGLDEIVLIESGRKGYRSAAGPKRFYAISGAPHNGVNHYDSEGYHGAIGEFLRCF